MARHRGLGAALLAAGMLACGTEATSTPDGGDGGQMLAVTLRYIQDAGYDYSGSHVSCAPTLCISTKTMTAEQYVSAVRPSFAGQSDGACSFSEPSATTRLINCTTPSADGGACYVPSNSSDCVCRPAPSFASSGACDWTPASH